MTSSRSRCSIRNASNRSSISLRCFAIDFLRHRKVSEIRQFSRKFQPDTDDSHGNCRFSAPAGCWSREVKGSYASGMSRASQNSVAHDRCLTTGPCLITNPAPGRHAPKRGHPGFSPHAAVGWQFIRYNRRRGVCQSVSCRKRIIGAHPCRPVMTVGTTRRHAELQLFDSALWPGMFSGHIVTSRQCLMLRRCLTRSRDRRCCDAPRKLDGCR